MCACVREEKGYSSVFRAGLQLYQQSQIGLQEELSFARGTSIVVISISFRIQSIVNAAKEKRSIN